MKYEVIENKLDGTFPYDIHTHYEGEELFKARVKELKQYVKETDKQVRISYDYNNNELKGLSFVNMTDAYMIVISKVE